MITYSKLGNPRRGRLGNQLFQIASTIGIARRYGHDWTLPMWKYSMYFKSLWSSGGRFECMEVPEVHFHFDETGLEGSDHYSIDGWRQSEKYWQGHEKAIREQFTFSDQLVDKVKSDLAAVFTKPVIAISVRRGDFVDNPNYWQIPAMYYVSALVENFPNLEDYNILIFSDDVEYCRIHFECLDNAFFYNGIDIEQLCAMSLCDHFIVSNSTFSWWGAYLGEKKGSKVFRPAYLFDGNLLKQHDDRDYWPERWIVWDHAGRRLDLQDVTFTIPVFLDHNHRRSNLELCLCLLNRDLDTHIIVGEQGSHGARRHEAHARYHFFTGMREFHRTKMLNDMALMASTRFVVNWDCDVAIVPLQLWKAVQALRSGADMVYPYDGRFARVPRVPWFGAVSRSLDLGIFRDTEFGGKNGKPLPTTSVGGAIMFNRESFIAGGMENENMISFGPEDWERFFRFNILGYRVERTPGALYHFDHYCGPTSSTRNPYFRRNHNELDMIRALDRKGVEELVSTWKWNKIKPGVK